jgi:hypothetical protein
MSRTLGQQFDCEPSDIELFAAFTLEIDEKGSELWEVVPKRGGVKPYKRKMGAELHAERIAKYRAMAESNIPLFGEESEDENV